MLNRWLYLNFNWLRSPIKDLFPEIHDWNIGDKFIFYSEIYYKANNREFKKFYCSCYIRSISSKGKVLVESAGSDFLIFSLAKFMKIAYNQSLKDKQLAVTLSLNTDNILKEK